MTITETTTIAEIAAALPSSIRVFQRRDIDFCCGSKRPLGDVCRDRGLDFTEIATEIEAAAATAPTPDHDWSVEPLAALTSHIMTAYHEPLRDELRRLQAMSAKVAAVHGKRDPRLTRIAEMVRELSSDLLLHMQKEELVLFPAIEALEGGKDPTQQIDAPISVMEHEHDDAGVMLAELRASTDGYEPPEWACTTMRALYQGLAAIEATMHVHVHLENNVLFPRALRLAHVRAGG